MFKLLKEVFRTGTATTRYPFAPLPASPNYRGKPQYDPERCIACGACIVACPANALSIASDVAAGTRTWEICFGRCIFCGRCEEVCPTEAIVLSPEYETAVMDRADLYQTAEFRLAKCRVCGTPFTAKKEIDYLVSVLNQSGLTEAQIEEQRAEFETCPACKRMAEARRDNELSDWLRHEDLPAIRKIDLGTPPSRAEGRVTLTIDGMAVSAPEGTSILRAAEEAGIVIPKLCATESEHAFGSCRLCLVEIEGRGGTPASCTTPVAEGLVVHTRTERLQQIRRGVMDLYISDHPLACRDCAANGDCELQDMALLVGVRETRYGYDGANHLKAQKDTSNPYFTFDPAKCILCSRCVRACEEIQGTFALTIEGRGFDSRVTAGMGGSFLASDCVSCGACIEACPTETLIEKTVIADGMPLTSVITTCPYCDLGCSFRAELRDDELIRMVPDKDGKANHAHACVKGRFAWKEATNKDRILTPMIREKTSDPWRGVSWQEAIGRAASEFRRIQEERGRDAIGAIVSSHCTNEEAFLVQKLVRTGFGNNNIDTFPRDGQSAAGDGLLTTFGTSAGTQDFDSVDEADVIMLIGTNPADSHPVFASRLKRRLHQGARLIVIDPRRVDLVRAPHVAATHHLALKPGTDVAVLAAFAHVIVKEGLVDEAFIGEHCEEFEEWAAFVGKKRNSPEEVEKISGVPAEVLRTAARLYATGGNAAIYYGDGIAASGQSANTVAAIADLAMATGNIGRPGVGVIRLQAQNNAQGSGDMGAYPDTLPGHRHLSDEAARATIESFWGSKLNTEAGLGTAGMLHAAREGSLKGLYVQGADVAASELDERRVLADLAAMECVVVQDLFLNETAAFAHVFLPGSIFLEKDGTFTNAERRISRIRKAMEPRNGYTDWEITLKLAQAMGAHMAYSHPSEIMDEIAQCTPIFAGVSYAKLDALGSIQWPCNDEAPSGTKILHARRFEHGKGKFVVTHYLPTDQKTGAG